MRLISKISHYFSAELLRFVMQILIFYSIFNTLSIKDYSYYVLIQTLVSILVITFSLNIDSSMQKLYSKKKLAKYGNLAYFIITLSLIVIFSAFFFISHLIINFDQLLIFSGQVALSTILLYVISSVLINIAQSYFNANELTFRYISLSVMQPVIMTAFLFYLQNFSLNEVIIFSIVSNTLPILILIKFDTYRFPEPVNQARLKKIMVYILRYSLPSFPAALSKNSLEYFARIGIYKVNGEIGLAALAFVYTIFSIFRSVEKSFFRAVTPIMLKTKFRRNDDTIVRLLVLSKMIFVGFLVCTIELWRDAVWYFFPTKPREIILPALFYLMAIVYSTSLVKNYYMALAKRNINNLSKFFWITAVLHSAGCLFAILIEVSVVYYLYLLITINFINIIALWAMSRRYKKRTTHDH